MVRGTTDAHEPQAERIDLPDADVVFYRSFFSGDESDRFFEELTTHAAWKQERIKYYGKVMDLPRQTAWYGDEGKSYVYSGIRVDPQPWTATLLTIKRRVESVSEVTFNSVLLNLYRHGRDSVAWHSDDEPDLGPDPVIGSVSFGETRTFWFRHRRDHSLRFKIELPHGSYLLMRGQTQHFWVHQIPKTTRHCEPRINLTFRVIKEVRSVRPNPQGFI
ncbi:MAG: alpha-ketoglutarate-dependent dioxygenase AlkB [Chloroflexi bacterium]|nr:alpha-ketoglutarate-dependent dioxygenase AlkB [Chloroflexota bacterium]